MDENHPIPTIKRRGLMLVLSSPSGAGKTTLSKALLGSRYLAIHLIYHAKAASQ